jgi:hypothetical protein
MAVTLQQIYTLRYSTTGVYNRVVGACLKAAAAIINESAGTSNHANRLIWANACLSDPHVKARQIMSEISLNATIQTAYNPASANEGVTDNDLEFVTNSSIDKYATGA